MDVALCVWGALRWRGWTQGMEEALYEYAGRGLFDVDWLVRARCAGIAGSAVARAVAIRAVAFYLLVQDRSLEFEEADQCQTSGAGRSPALELSGLQWLLHFHLDKIDLSGGAYPRRRRLG